MIHGILFTQNETGNVIRCSFCNNTSDMGFYVEPETDDERDFIKYLLQDESNWCINQCCIEKIKKEVSKKGFEFDIASEPSLDIVDQSFDYDDVSSSLFEEIDSNHEFYIVKTKNGGVFWGFLVDYNSSSLQLNNCYKFDHLKQEWEHFGNIDDREKYWIDIVVEEITSIEKAPYSMKDPKDYGLDPFMDKKSNGL